MNAAVLYYSRGGSTKRLSDVFKDFARYDAACIPKIDWADLIVFLCPTAGDRELPLPMEDTLLQLAPKPRLYTVCEMGDSGGYFYEGEFMGPIPIIRRCLEACGWKQAVKCLTLETVPTLNASGMARFLAWKEEIVSLVRQNHS